MFFCIGFLAFFLTKACIYSTSVYLFKMEKTYTKYVAQFVHDSRYNQFMEKNVLARQEIFMTFSHLISYYTNANLKNNKNIS
jgi:hypothetical protein